MSFACPSLPSNLIPFPALNPQWDTGAIHPEQLPNAEAIANILLAQDAEPLALRLNARGLEASRNCRPDSHEIWRSLEQAHPGIVEELYLFHVDQSEPKEQAPAQTAVRKTEKRQLLTTYTANKAQRTDEQAASSLTQNHAHAPVSMYMDEAGWDEPSNAAPEASMQSWEDSDPATPLIQLLHEFIASDGAMFWEDIMDDISREVSKLKSRNMLQRVPNNLYRQAFRFVESAVTQCTTTGRWGETETEQCLSAIVIVMEVISEEAVGPGVYSDELLQCIISIIEGFINRVILPTVEKEYKEQQVLETEKKESGRRGRPRARDRQSRDWRSECMRKSALVTHPLNLLTDVLGVEAIRFQDGELLRISQMSLNLFFVEGADALYHLQYTSVNLLQAVFAFYSQHRDNVISEVVVRASTWKPASKECSYSLPPPRMGSIQMLSALILQLLQGVAVKPAVLGDAGRDAASSSAKSQNAALPLVVMLVKQLVDKLTVKRGEGHSGSGYKPLFQTLVVDCCAVLGSPEWPVAPLMLRALWKYAYEMCSKESFPLTHRNLAAELLGTIVIRVQQIIGSSAAPRIQDAGHEHASYLPPQQTLKDLQEQQQGIIRRFMQREQRRREGAVMMEDEPETPLLNLDVFDDENEAACKLYAQQLVLNFLADKATKDAAAVHAHRSWIATWIEDPPHPSATPCYELQWSSHAPGSSVRGCACPSAAEANALATYLVSRSYKFEEVIKPLLILLKNPKMPVFRQKALKALSSMVEEDPEMLTQESVRQAVSGSMTDASKSVRAEAVLLVGKFMSKSDNLTMQYYESICARCKDAGSSVRKAALNILRDLLCREGQLQSVVEGACVAIIPLLKDESDDIKKRTCAILKEMWFPHAASESGADSNHRSNLSVPARFEQMRHVVNAAYKSTSTVGREAASVTEVLEDFMRSTIKENPKNAEECAKFCQEALQCIIREHEEGEDGNNGEAKGVTASLLSQFRTLALLATVQPSLIVKDMELLHQHLSSHSYSTADGKPWGQDQCQLIGTVAAIYDCVLPHLADPPKHLVQYLQQDLPKLVRFAPNMQLLTISIKCLCTLVKSVGSSVRSAKHMHQVLTLCFNHETQRLTDPEFKAKPRSLVIAGLFCRFSNFTLPVSEKDTPAIPENRVQWLFDVCINKFVRHQMAAYRRAGYACLGSLFVRKPTLVLKESSKKALACGLADKETEEIRAVALKALADFVEEDVSDTQATSLRNSVMQNYLERILACVYCKSEETATAALKLVATIHERGQVHPQLCIPDLVAVQQRGRVCAAVGYTVLKAISEKYPDYYTPEVFVQGVLKAHPLKGGGAVNTEVFSRSYELRLPNNKFVQRTIKHVMEKMKQAATGDRDEMLESVEAKKFLLGVVAALPYPNGDQAQALITQAGEAGIMMGTATMTMLKTDLAMSGMKEDEAEGGKGGQPVSEIGEGTLKLMEEAARAFLLLELRKLLSNAYAGKTAFPVDVGVPYMADNLLGCETVTECYQTLKNALRQASDAPAPGTQITGKKRGRPAKHVEKSAEEEDAELEKEMMAEIERMEKGGGDDDSDQDFASAVEMMHD